LVGKTYDNEYLNSAVKNAEKKAVRGQ